MLTHAQIQELKSEGFLRVPSYLNDKEINSMMISNQSMKDTLYTEDNLRDRVTYLSDNTETRVSNAFMVTVGDSPLPSVKAMSGSSLESILSDYMYILAQLDDTCVSQLVDTRVMFNMQEYKESSKPVPWHFDGEYLDFNSDQKDGALQLNKVIVPSYVVVYTLYNNNPLGTAIKSLHSNEEFQVESEAGDMFIFDNTSFLHSVPELEKDRAMFGFRNFDYNPKLYSQDYSKDSFFTTNQCFTGFAEEISTEESIKLQEAFIESWKENFNEDLKAKF